MLSTVRITTVRSGSRNLGDLMQLLLACSSISPLDIRMTASSIKKREHGVHTTIINDTLLAFPSVHGILLVEGHPEVLGDLRKRTDNQLAGITSEWERGGR